MVREERLGLRVECFSFGQWPSLIRNLTATLIPSLYSLYLLTLSARLSNVKNMCQVSSSWTIWLCSFFSHVSCRMLKTNFTKPFLTLPLFSVFPVAMDGHGLPISHAGRSGSHPLRANQGRAGLSTSGMSHQGRRGARQALLPLYEDALHVLRLQGQQLQALSASRLRQVLRQG